jgi:alginate O-acetyltransferase complex protein AlgI
MSAMLFGSPVFQFVFLPLVLALHLILPRPLRNGMLLGASLVFYAWGEPLFVLVMLVSLAMNWLFGLAIDRQRQRKSDGGRSIVAAAVFFNLALLGVFKYANFVWDNVAAALTGLGTGIALEPLEPIPLPIGISFFTFQALSYVVDVYRRDGPVQRNPLDFALYVAMFPQLIAGPIVRYRDIARQLAERVVTRAGFAYGVRRFVLGLGKKLLLADVAGAAADGVFALPPGELTAATAWLGTVCFTLQIYFDFSGYSDMAIGLGRMFGFRFVENFDYPYISRSLTEFWRRWNISLTNWFRDYLYFPLGGSRGGPGRTTLNLVTVFVLCGLWHGASWTFIVWGVYHGLFLMLERRGLKSALERAPAVVGHAYVLVVIFGAMTLFRCETLAGAGQHALALAGLGAGTGLYPLGQFVDPLLVTVLVVGAVFSTPVLPAAARWRERLVEDTTRARALDGWLEVGATIGVVAVLFACSLQVSAGTYSPFLYFRF